MTHDEMEKVAAIALPILGGAWGGVRYVIPHVRKAYVNGRGLVNTILATADDVTLIKKEVFPNGGSSLRDTVDTTRNIQREIRMNISILRQSVRTLMDETPMVGRWESDWGGQCVWVNQALCDWMGLTVEQAVGNGWSGGIHDDDREEVFERWTTAAIEKRPFSMTYRLRNHKTGATTKCSVEGKILTGHDGTCIGWSGTARPVTGGTPVAGLPVIES